MRIRRRTYTAATPPSLLPEALPVSGTRMKKCTGKAKGKRGSKKNTGLWDRNIPSDLLQEILSRLELKANIQSSTVCKAWCEAAVSVRKSQHRPLLLHAMTGSTYIKLADPLRSPSQVYKVDFPVLKGYEFSCSKDGWVLVSLKYKEVALFLNPFTKKHFYLPHGTHYYLGNRLAFSAAPTSSSCVVISYRQVFDVLIDTWRPGESAWTTHRFEHFKPGLRWEKCLFSNGVFYILSSCGHLGVFDPYEATWNVLPVEPCPAFIQDYVYYPRPVHMTEHEEDIFVVYTNGFKSTTTVYKLNLKLNVWEEKRDLGSLTVFTSVPGSFIRFGLRPEERNKIYPSFIHGHGKIRHGMYYYYYSLGDGKTSNPPPNPFLSRDFAWVEPPHNYFNLCLTTPNRNKPKLIQ